MGLIGLNPFRSYQFVRNEVVPYSGTHQATIKRVFLRLIEIYTSFTNSRWTFAGSSDGSTAGMDGVNRLTDESKIVASASGAHSWIVITQAGTGIKYLIAFDKSSNFDEATRVVSLAGFSGGSTTSRPTAVDERVLPPLSTNNWISSSGGSADYVIQVMHSLDGRQTLTFVYGDNNCLLMSLFARAEHVVTGWATPYVAFHFPFNGVYPDSYESIFFKAASGDMLSPRIKSWGPSGGMDLWPTTIMATLSTGFPLNTFHNVADPLQSSFIPLPIGLFSPTTGMIGRHGRLVDLSIVATAAPNGLYPGTSGEWAVFGNYVVPWGGGPTPQYA